MAYNGNIDLINGIRPKNSGSFPLVDAKDVYVDDQNRLDDKIDKYDGLGFCIVNGKLCVKHLVEE